MHSKSGLICDKITSHRLPRSEEKEDGEIHKFSDWTFTVLLRVLLTCYRARVAFVEHSEVPEKAYIFTFAELGFVRISAHTYISVHRASTDSLISIGSAHFHLTQFDSLIIDHTLSSLCHNCYIQIS